MFGMVDWWMLDVKVLVGWCRKMNVGENDRGVVGRGGEGRGAEAYFVLARREGCG